MESVAKVIEINAASMQSIEDAVQKGLDRAASTIDGIQGAWVSDIEVRTDAAGRVSEWRVRLRVSFLLR